MKDFILDYIDNLYYYSLKAFFYSVGDRKLAEEKAENWSKTGRKALIKYLSMAEIQPKSKDINTFIGFNPIKNNRIVKGKKREILGVQRFIERKIKVFTDVAFLVYLLTDKIHIKYFDDVFRIKLCKGQQITENYENGIGGYSCMTGNSAECTKLYEMNPNKFEQIVVELNKNSARSIVFNLDCGKTYCCDLAVYANSEDVGSKLRGHIIKQGWTDIGKSLKIVSGLVFEIGCFPFVDSLGHYKIIDNKMTIFHHSVGMPYDGILDCVDGYIDEGISCHYCEERINDDDEIYMNYLTFCSSCFHEQYFSCELCNDYYNNDYGYLVEDLDVCEGCFESKCSCCDECRDNFLNKNMNEASDGENMCNDCLDKHERSLMDRYEEV